MIRQILRLMRSIISNNNINGIPNENSFYSFVTLHVTCSGKAAYGMMKEMAENPTDWEGRRVLFIHTGGLLGLFDKTEEMAALVGKWRTMDVHESVARADGTGKMF